jgi:phosphatidylglycerol:prolipoprotein diacylglycerol transferase
MFPGTLTFGPLALAGYTFFYVLGIAAACLLILLLARKEKLDSLETFNYILLGTLASLLGSKLLATAAVLLGDPAASLRRPRLLLDVARGGGMISGAIIAGAMFALLYTKYFFKCRRWQVLDVTVIGVALGHGIGRLGCFCAGCCYGLPTALPWGVKFPRLGGQAHPFAQVFVHPTQIYEALINLANFVFLLRLRRKRKFPGQVFAWYLINYGVIRFTLEYLRNDGGRGYLFRGGGPLASFTFPQLLAVVMIVSGTSILCLKKPRPSRDCMQPD